jgi:IPT/TIG domain-containing protein
MTLGRRLAASAAATLLALAIATVPANAATKRVTPTRKPIAAPVTRPATVLPPEIYQLNPTRVDPTVQPNVMIMGQHMTPTTTVAVGGRPAQTVQVPDTNHVLIKLPDNLSTGTYAVEVTNEAGTAVADDALVVDGGTQISTLQYAVAGGFLIVLVLVMRLARTPGL